MRIQLHIIILLGIFGLFCRTSLAQENRPTELLPPPSITAIASYGLNEGLSNNCLENVIKDPKGRLWITTCENQASYTSDIFYQYDGKQAFYYPFISDEPIDSLGWNAIGVTENGFLYGKDRKDSFVFAWHPDTREKYFYPIASGEEILNVTEESAEKILALTRIDNAYRVYRFSEGKQEIVGEIALEFPDSSKYWFPHPFVVTEDHAWFLHQALGLVKVSLAGKEMQYHPFAALSNTPIKAPVFAPFDHHSSIGWMIKPWSTNSILLYLGEDNGFFTLDHSNVTLSAETALNKQLLSTTRFDYRQINLSEDTKGNVLINLGGRKAINTRFESIQSVLLDSKGQLHDYTQVIRSMRDNAQYRTLTSGEGKFFSRDFQLEIGWNSFAGLVLADLQLNLDILAYPMPQGSRAIINLDSTNLLVSQDIGIKQVELNTGKIANLTDNNLGKNYLSSMWFRNDRTLWLAGSDKTLIRYDLVTKERKRFPLGLEFDKFFFLNENEILLFSRQGQLFFYDLRTKEKRPYAHQGSPFSLKSAPNDLIYSTEGLLWVAAQNGLWRIDLVNDQITHWNKESGFPDENIMCINPGEEETLWLGTANGGVLVFSPTTNEVRQISMVEGLSHNTVAGILSDQNLNRWVATFNGITVISPKGEVLFYISDENGLTDSEFNRTSYGKLSDGRLGFGGVQGLNILNPVQIENAFAERDSLRIYLTSLAYFDKDANADQEQMGYPLAKAPISIPAANRYLSLDFGLSEYINLQDHSYAYRVIDQKSNRSSDDSAPWTNLGTTSELTLRNLPVGDHIIQIRGIDHEGDQTNVPLEVAIHVEQFFYRTWWFYMLCILVVSLAATAWVRRILTERKRLQVEVKRRTAQIQEDKEIIERQAHELQRLDETKSLFFANISHEFRTPLTIISGMIDQIEKRPQQWLQEGAKMIRRNNENLLDLINQILELQKLESGELKVNLQLGDIMPLLHKIFEQFRAFADSKVLELQFNTEVESLHMDHDPEKVLRILSNLLSNAIKFTPEHGIVTFSVSTQINPDLPQGKFAVLRVQDTGAGIPQKQLPHIFDRFFQASGNQQGTGVGTGIGLSLTQQLVKLLNGHIEVESQEGAGTTFQVFLPITRAANPGKRVESRWLQGAVFGKQELPGKGVPSITDKNNLPIALIVEDNRDVAQYLQICLEGHYQLELASNGQEGIDRALELIPDIIISDVMMPEKDGLELCQVLKEDIRTSHIPIILLTAKSDVASRITGLKHGADDYLAKPFHEEELAVRMSNLLHIRRTLQERYKNLYAHQLPPLTEESTSREDEFIMKLKELLESRIDDPAFDLDQLSKELFISRSQLGRKIKALTGKSPAIFIRSIRLQKARQLLLTTDLAVKEVAYDVGFSNPEHFSRSYSKEFGESPLNTSESKHLRK